MASRSWKPVRFSVGWESDIDELFEQLIDTPWGRSTRVTWHPAIDLHEAHDAYVLVADLPGVKPDTVELFVREHEVTICGSRPSYKLTETAVSVVVERQVGKFCRSFHLEHSVEKKSADIEYREGIFLAKLPKKNAGNDR